MDSEMNSEWHNGKPHLNPPQREDFIWIPSPWERLGWGSETNSDWQLEMNSETNSEWQDIKMCHSVIDTESKRIVYV